MNPRAILRAKEDEMAKRKSTEPEGLTLDQRRIAETATASPR
jgi:hypothetical protein